tara:strand:- start:414 stop:650 length:237 start_codon:yes stop_codon:yes gene_type:complete
MSRWRDYKRHRSWGGRLLQRKPDKKDVEELVAYLAQHRVAEFEGQGIKVKFYQELPDLMPRLQQQPTEQELKQQFEQF